MSNKLTNNLPQSNLRRAEDLTGADLLNRRTTSGDNNNGSNSQNVANQYPAQNETFQFQGEMLRRRLDQAWVNRNTTDATTTAVNGGGEYLPKTLTFTPQELRAFPNSKGKLPPQVKIGEAHFEQKLFQSYGFDEYAGRDRAILQQLFGRENPGDGIDWTTNGTPIKQLTATLNSRGQYEVQFSLSKDTDQKLQQASVTQLFSPNGANFSLFDSLSKNVAAGNYQQTAENPDLTELALDVTQMGLDVVGIFEPTPFADLTNTGISVVRGNWGDAALSVLGVIPYVGDLAKLGKIPKWIASINKIAGALDKLQDVVRYGGKGAEAAKQFIAKAKAVIDSLPIDKLPDALRDAVKAVKQKIDDFISQMKKTDNPADSVKNADNNNVNNVKNGENGKNADKIDEQIKTPNNSPNKQSDGVEPPKEPNKIEADEIKKQKEIEETRKQKEIEEANVRKQKEIDDKYSEVARDGHAVQRHGEGITERQLDDRAMYGKDPITGTTNDAFKKDVNGNPLPHKSGKDATKFDSKEALVKAADYVKNSQEYKDALEAAEKAGDDFFVVKNSKLEDVFGANYKDQVFGKTRVGSKNNPTGTVETDFSDGTIKAVYIKDSNGKWNLETMYPEPK